MLYIGYTATNATPCHIHAPTTHIKPLRFGNHVMYSFSSKMSVPEKADLKAKLRELECPFTWDISKADIADLEGITEKLQDRVKFCPHRYHATYLNILSFVSHVKGNNEGALEFLSKAEAILKADKEVLTAFLVTYANFAWVHFHSGNLGDVETYLGKLEEICKGVSGALQYSCNLPEVHGEKAWTFLRLGATYYKRAKVSFEKALEGDAGNVSFNVGYGVVLYRIEGLVQDERLRSKKSEAIPQLEKALLLDPDNAEVMVLLALKLQKSDKYKSLKLIEGALKLSSDVPQVMRYVAKYFRGEDSTEASLDILEKVLEQTPSSSFLHHQIGMCHKQQLIKMLQKGPGSCVPANLKRAKAEQCVKHFSKAVELKPSNTHAQVNLAEAYSENEQLTEAEEIFTELLRGGSLRDPEKQHVQTSYGLFLLYKKRAEDRAVVQLKAAYRMKMQNYNRKQAGRKLEQIAGRWRKNRQRAAEASEILAFLRAEDKLSAETDLSAAFERGMKFK
ncbi:interferon-induced protein with tetratricopeptide repeats 5-like [Conger conger]|uniref:interferon-induced protein with tetratricopeptide repeats 5-like n=1 Tax=Conger conger TaxID=82655 RepID=UPI002A5A42C9|nr:interferon-induced protein with tetratricopeptide repeats 5-like [Conger conger]